MEPINPSCAPGPRARQFAGVCSAMAGQASGFRGGWGFNGGPAVWLVLNIREPHPSHHGVEGIDLKGVLKTSRIISHDTANSRNIEVLIDVTSDVRTGSNLIAFEVTVDGWQVRSRLIRTAVGDSNRRRISQMQKAHTHGR